MRQEYSTAGVSRERQRQTLCQDVSRVDDVISFAKAKWMIWTRKRDIVLRESARILPPNSIR
jgi:hypothetical protein